MNARRIAHDSFDYLVFYKTLARNILRLVKEENARYSDIAVVCCDFEAYMPTLKNVFDSFSIPFYADVQQPH